MAETSEPTRTVETAIVERSNPARPPEHLYTVSARELLGMPSGDWDFCLTIAGYAARPDSAQNYVTRHTDVGAAIRGCVGVSAGLYAKGSGTGLDQSGSCAKVGSVRAAAQSRTRDSRR